MSSPPHATPRTMQAAVVRTPHKGGGNIVNISSTGFSYSPGDGPPGPPGPPGPIDPAAP